MEQELICGCGGLLVKEWNPYTARLNCTRCGMMVMIGASKKSEAIKIIKKATRYDENKKLREALAIIYQNIKGKAVTTFWIADFIKERVGEAELNQVLKGKGEG